jgi:uncharacterized protein (TIGR02145 family)
MKKILSLLAISFSIAFAYAEKDFHGWWTFSGKFEPIDPVVSYAIMSEFGTRDVPFSTQLNLAISGGDYKFLQFEANRKCVSTIINCPGWRFRNNKIEIENSNIQIEIISAKEIDIYQYNQKYTLKKAGTVEQFKKWVNQKEQEQAKAKKQKEEEAKANKEAERKHAEWLASPEGAKWQKAEEEKTKQREKYVQDSIEAVEAMLKAMLKNGLTDTRNGNKYKVVRIGKQVWMAENLNYKTEGSKCYGEGGEINIDGDKIKLSNDDVQALCKKTGRLYNNFDQTIVCPSGWRLPSDEEWQILVDFVGGKEIAGKKLKSKDFWNGTDDYGFSALPAGRGEPGEGGASGRFFFYGLDETSTWFTQFDDHDNWYWSMNSKSSSVGRGLNNRKGWFSIRCVKN